MYLLGRIAYEAYAGKRNWKTFNGDKMPTFEDQDPGLQEAWQAAAQAVVEEILDQPLR